MTNARRKGKRGERWLATQLRPIFPQVQRNLEKQCHDGGRDLVNTGGFDFEMKCGRMYQSKLIREILNQLEDEARPDAIRVAVVKPDRETPYALLPFADFLRLIRADP